MKEVRLLADSYYQGDDKRSKGQVIEVSDEEAERLESIGAAGPANQLVSEPTPLTPEGGNQPEPTDNLGDLTKPELQQRAKDLGLEGYSDLNKADLLAAVRDAQE